MKGCRQGCGVEAVAKPLPASVDMPPAELLAAIVVVGGKPGEGSRPNGFGG
jgi:hypothetical protein